MQCNVRNRNCPVLHYFFLFALLFFSANCLAAGSSRAIISNTVPDANIVSPNGGVNVSGTFTVDFNVVDPNRDDLNFKLAYSSTAGSFSNVIVTNSSLSSLCTTTNWVRTTRCSYSWDTTGVQGIYYLDINVFDSRLAGHVDSSDSNFTVNFSPSSFRADYNASYAINSGRGGMGVNWANVNGETGYKLYRSSNGGINWANIATLGANVTYYNDANMSDNNSLVYKVTATNGAFESDYSTADANITVDRSPPSIPVIASAVGGSQATSHVDLNWQLSDDNSSYANFMDQNLVGYWRFQEGTGTTVTDSSGNLHNGTISGPSFANGKMGTGLNFTGYPGFVAIDINRGGYGTSPWDFNTRSFSIAAWFKKNLADTCVNGWCDIIRYDTCGSSSGGWSLSIGDNGLPDGKVILYALSGWRELYPDFNVVSTSRYDDGKWHFAVGVRDSSTGQLRLYVDGVQAATPTEGNDYEIVGNIDANLAIGRCGSDTDNVGHFKGSIDEVMVYDKAISAADANSLYLTGALKYDLNRSLNNGASYSVVKSGYDLNTFADTTATDINVPIYNGSWGLNLSQNQITPAWNLISDSGTDYNYYATATDYQGNWRNSSVSGTRITSGIVNYFVHCVSGGTGCTDSYANNDESSVTYSSLDWNRQYCYQLRAIDYADNNSAYTSSLCKYTVAKAPSISSVNCTYSSGFRCVVSFDMNSNPAGTDYYIDENTGASGGSDSGWINAASPYTDTGLATGTEYCYKIKARNGDGVETGWSSQVCGTQPNNAPLINWINVCDSGSGCGPSKTLNPGDAFVVDVNVFDPDNDLNWDSTRIEFYPTADSNGASADWDHITLNPATSTASQYGCDAGTSGTGDDNCFSVTSSDWTTKFAKGGTDVYARVCDTHGGCGNLELTSGITVNAYPQGFSFDSNFSFSGLPDSNNNALNSAGSNAYLLITNTSNVSIDVNMLVGNLTSGSDNITYNNMHWKLTAGAPGTYFASTFAAGTGDVVKASLSRGSYPTNGTQNLYAWLNIPLGTPSGTYTGTYNFYTKES